MTPRSRRPTALAAALLVAAGALVGCGSDEGDDPPAEPAAATSSPAPGTAGADAGSAGDADNGRAFGADDDAVIRAVEVALESLDASASWEGKTLRVEMKGSAEQPTAYLYCTVVQGLVAEDERGVFVYEDGEADCEDDPRRAG